MKFKNSIIPTVLASIILVAGMFAFVPIQDASTVHTIIQAGTSTVECETTTNADVSDTTEITITADDDFILQAVYIEFDGGDDNENTDFPGLTIIAGQGAEANTIALGDIGVDPGAGDATFEFLRMNDDIAFTGTSLTLIGNSFTIPFEMTAGTEDDDESLTVTACGIINPIDADSLAVGISD